MNLIENPGSVVEIRKRREVENSGIEKEGVWTVSGGGSAECVSVDLFELRHVRTFIEQLENTAVAAMLSCVAIVVAVDCERRLKVRKWAWCGCEHH